MPEADVCSLEQAAYKPAKARCRDQRNIPPTKNKVLLPSSSAGPVRRRELRHKLRSSSSNTVREMVINSGR